MKKILLRTFILALLLSLSACTPDPPRKSKAGSSVKIETHPKNKKEATSNYPNDTVLGVLDKENLEKENDITFSEKTDTGLIKYTVDSDNIIQKIEIDFDEQPLNKKLNKIFFLSAIEEQLPPDSELKDIKNPPADSQVFESKDYKILYNVHYTVNKNDEVTSIEIEVQK